MNYELAKKLKEARFEIPLQSSQKARYFVWHKKEIPRDDYPYTFTEFDLQKAKKSLMRFIDKDWDYQNATYIPTLSELIDACGDRFKMLFRTSEGEYIASGLISPGRENTDKALDGKFEKTPEEAVANLWLALNKKS